MYLYSSGSPDACNVLAPQINPAGCGKSSETIHPKRVENSVLAIGYIHLQTFNSMQNGLETGGRFPHPMLRIGPGHDSRNHAARYKCFNLVIAQRVGLPNAREV